MVSRSSRSSRLHCINNHRYHVGNEDVTDAKEVDVLLLSPDGLRNTAELRMSEAQLAEDIENWQLNGTKFDRWGLPPSAFKSPSEAPTETTDSSAASMFTDPGGRIACGTWITERLPIDPAYYEHASTV